MTEFPFAFQRSGMVTASEGGRHSCVDSNLCSVYKLDRITPATTMDNSLWYQSSLSCGVSTDCDDGISACAGGKDSDWRACSDKVTDCCDQLQYWRAWSFCDAGSNKCWFANPGRCIPEGSRCAYLESSPIDPATGSPYTCSVDSDCSVVCNSQQTNNDPSCAGVCVSRSQTNGKAVKQCAIKKTLSSYNGVRNPTCCDSMGCSLSNTDNNYYCS